jgi:hypothetical protein
MRWHRHGLTSSGGVAALAIGGAMLLEDASAAIMPAISMVAARRPGARQSRAVQAGMDALEQRDWRERSKAPCDPERTGQPNTV